MPPSPSCWFRLDVSRVGHGRLVRSDVHLDSGRDRAVHVDLVRARADHHGRGGPDADPQRDGQGHVAAVAAAAGEAAGVQGREDRGGELPVRARRGADGRIFFSELWVGQIRRDGSVNTQPWADVNAKYGIQWTEFFHGGLSGIALDPDFSRNRFVYVVTQAGQEDGLR